MAKKQKKVKNVIKGYLSKFDIKNLHLIDTTDNIVCFSGDIQKYLNPNAGGVNMILYKKECDERTVINVINHNDVALFIFVE